MSGFESVRNQVGSVADLNGILAGIEKMKTTLNAMPPPPFFASSHLLMTSQAVQFVHENRIHVGAHPEFWWRIKPPAAQQIGFNKLIGIQIVDLDWDLDSRQIFCQAMAAAMRGGQTSCAL